MQLIKQNAMLFGLAIFLVIALGVVAFLFFWQSSSPTQPATEIPLPTSNAVRPTVTQRNLPRASGNPVAIDSLPKRTLPNGGSTINLEASSRALDVSEQEVTKLSPHFPFDQDLTLTDGTNVTILVPSKQYQDDPWKLTVNIFGIAYGVASSSADYQKQKNNFLEATTYLFGWIRSHQVDPNNMIIKWGDEAYIQRRAEEWLTSN